MYKYPSLLCHNISVEIYFQDQLRYDMSTEDRKIIAKLLKRFYYSCFIMHPAGDVLWVFVEPGNVVP